MSLIKILSPEEAQKIAAGEVIERPASIVKELLENSLDANATEITLYVEQAGKKLIRIIDNGSGMSPEDAQMCILAHATSKIRSVEELTSITTFGFRGEALASIAAISSMQLITRRTDADAALCLTSEPGTNPTLTTAAGNIGTDITLRSIFETVPARRKFLKSDRTEWNAIEQLMTAYALNYPECKFVVYHNHQQVMHCSPRTTLLERAEQLLDQALIQRLISFEAEDMSANISISGILSDHQYSRYDRGGLSSFVNRRWVRNHKLGTALIKGYQDVLPTGSYPYAVIKIRVPSETIDINMHPRKEEVLFMHPRIVEQLITTTVRGALQEHITLAPAASVIPQSPYQTAPPLAFPLPVLQPFAQQMTQNPYAYPHRPTGQEIQHTILPPPPSDQPFASSVTPETKAERGYRIIGSLDNTYILLETSTGLMLIDQHAAHERVLYEQIGRTFASAESVQLVFPEIINCSSQQVMALVEHVPLLASFGIEFEAWSATAVRVTSMPLYTKNRELKSVFTELVTQLGNPDGSAEASSTQKTLRHKVQAMIACKAAVKAHDVLSYEELQQLIEQFFTTENRLTCPHGRPTSWALSTSEIIRMFQRSS